MLLIKNGKIMTMSDKNYNRASILIKDKKIVEIGENINIETIETDTKDAENKVLRYDGTAITEGNVSSLIYKDVIKKDKTYYYSYKIRVADNDTNEGSLYVYNSNITVMQPLFNWKYAGVTMT